MKTNSFLDIKNKLLNEKPVNLDINLDSNTILLDWKISHYCNLNCSYCFFDRKVRCNQDKDLSIIAKMIELINSNDFHFVINICGGEPFLVQEIYKILGKIRAKSSFNVGTNLVYLNFKKLSSVIDKEDNILFPSYHYHFLKKGLRRNFIKNYLSLQKAGYNIVLLLVYNPNYSDKEILDTMAELKVQGVKNIYLKTFIGYDSGKLYPQESTDEYRNFLKNNGLILSEINIALNKFNLLNKKCLAGSQYFHINPNGDISLCDMTKIKIGNIKELNSFDEIANKYDFVCQRNTCFCLGPLINVHEKITNCDHI